MDFCNVFLQIGMLLDKREVSETMWIMCARSDNQVKKKTLLRLVLVTDTSLIVNSLGNSMMMCVNTNTLFWKHKHRSSEGEPP